MSGTPRGIAPSMNGMMGLSHHQNVGYNNNGYNPNPPSPQYGDYDIPVAPPNFLFDAPLTNSTNQNTVFNHIDWSEFLAPGQAPPPPTLVPDERQERLRSITVTFRMIA